MSDFDNVMDRVQDGLDKVKEAFPGPQTGDELTAIYERMKKLKEQKTETLPDGVSVFPLSKLNYYSRMQEMLSIYKDLVVPLMLRLEQKKLDSLINLANVTKVQK